MQVQTVRSGVIYVVGSFSAEMCPAKAVSLASKVDVGNFHEFLELSTMYAAVNGRYAY